MRAGFRWLTSILFLAIVVQVGLAGYGAFDVIHKAEKAATSVPKKTIEDAFDAHSALGSAIIAAMLVLVIISLAGRLGEGPLRWSGGIFLLGVLQSVLGAVSTSVPWLGVLHAINALAIVCGRRAARNTTFGAATAAGTDGVAPSPSEA